MSMAVAVSGCVLPVQGGDPDPFPEHKFDFIEVGVSTKDDISAAMSEFPIETREGDRVTHFQPMKFHDGAWWLYAAERSEAKWLWIDPWLGVPWTGPVVSGSQDYRYLLVRFDEQGIVSDYQLSRSEGGRCNESGVCASGIAYGVLDPEGAEPFEPIAPAPERCRIYLYGYMFGGLPVTLDGEAQGWLLGSRTYMSWEIDAGSHQIQSQTLHESEPVPWDFECQPGETLYIHLEPKTPNIWSVEYRTRFLKVSKREAQERLKKHRQLLIPSEIPDLGLLGSGQDK